MTLDAETTCNDYENELLESLDEQSISCIDFDRLREWLKLRSESSESIDAMRSDLSILREDYCARIGGMVKAVAAVDRERDRWTEACDLVERFPDMSIPELIDCYRRACARFRDHFPASFGLLRTDQSHSASLKNISDFK
jgi:hypothetical protein